MREQKLNHKFSADRPITSHKEDLLGVTDFAKSLASSIKGWAGKDSLVIALYGQWGSGKTSIKNLTIEALRQEKENTPLIVEFNPWQWAGQEQLAEAFFQEIGIAIGKPNKSRTDKNRAAKWRTYAAYLKTGSLIAASIKKTIASLLLFAAAIGIGGSLIEISWIKPVVIIFSLLALILAGIFKWGGSFADNLALLFESKGDAGLKSLSDHKNDLADILRKLNMPLFVVIDDIDRLSSQEIKYLFQLVKVNADFPNLVYLLLFQRDIVVNSLNDVTPVSGEKFLEKIIQVGFDIPQIEQPRIDKVLEVGLEELIKVKEIEKRFDKHRWGNIFIGALRPFFNNLRDVHRYLATFSFHISLFEDKGSFNVNPIDLITLEVLRVFEPKVYKKLFDIKYFLTGLYKRGFNSESANKEARTAIEGVIEITGEVNRAPVRELLKQLFPPIEWVFGGPHYDSGFADEWYRDLRVCHSDVFDRYFHFSIPEGDISQAELDEILSLVANREALISKFRSLKKRELLGVTLDRLEAYKEEIDLKHAVPYITAIMDIGDELPDEPSGFFSLGPDVHATRIIHWFLKKEQDETKRGEILKKAVRETTGLLLPLRKVSGQQRTEERQKKKYEFLVSENDLKELKQICVEKIQKASESGDLKSHPKMPFILFDWLNWASPEEPRTWVEKLVESNDGLLLFLKAFLAESKSYGMGDYVYKPRQYIRINNIESFISSDVIADKLNNLTREKLSDEEQVSVSAFEKAFKQKQEGKSDDEWEDDED